MLNTDTITKLLDDFDPNTLKVGNWATYVPNRRTAFKIHATRALALSAVSGAQSTLLFERVGSAWVERARKNYADKNHKCEQCGGDTEGQRFSYPHDYGAFYWLKNKGKIVSPPELIFVCQNCAPLFR